MKNNIFLKIFYQKQIKSSQILSEKSKNYTIKKKIKIRKNKKNERKSK